MRIGYLECFSGISGDMLLGALVDAGVPLAHLSEAAAALGLGAHLEARKITRGGITGTKVDVIASHDEANEVTRAGVEHSHGHSHPHKHGNEVEHSQQHDHNHSPDHEHAQEHGNEHGNAQIQAHDDQHGHEHHRSLSVILGIIRSAALPDDVKQRAMRGFQMLGEAEAAIHSIPIEKVHFHEVGAVDTIVDIVCAAAGAAYLHIDHWLSSPLNVGSGTVNCAHGILPVPAPATLALLADAPVYAAGPPMERVTPTGATILRMLDVKYSALPPVRIAASGYGAGGRDTPGQPNLLRLLVGESDEADTATEPIAILETVIDDSTPQLLAYVSDLLLAAGAWDVYRIPVQMKKGRTGTQITVLCRPNLVPALRDLLFRETTTIGMHWRVENKTSLHREFAEVKTQWGPVKIKIARWPSGTVANATPEYEDCRQLAVTYSVPLKEVMQEAARLYSAKHDTPGEEN
jgi:hypothetical protein